MQRSGRRMRMALALALGLPLAVATTAGAAVPRGHATLYPRYVSGCLH
jgi:hypothetical protein